MAFDEDDRNLFHEDDLPPRDLPLTEAIILTFLAILSIALVCWGFYWVAMRIFG